MKTDSIRVFKAQAVKDIMVTKPITIGVDDPFSKVVDLFKARRIRHLPVVDKNNKLVGIVTQRDLYRIASAYRTMEGELVYDKTQLDAFILKYVMTQGVVTLHPDDAVGKALELMTVRKFGCIPIVSGEGVLAGIVTQIDILRALTACSADT